MNLREEGRAVLTHAAAYWWRMDASRRRRWTILAAVAVAALGWALIWQPLQQSRARDAQRILALRNALQTMQADAAAAQSLRVLPPVAATSPRMLAETKSLDALFGGGAQNASTTLRIVDGRARFEVTVARVRFPVLLQALDEALRRYRLRLVSFDARRLASPPSAEVQARLLLEDGQN